MRAAYEGGAPDKETYEAAVSAILGRPFHAETDGGAVAQGEGATAVGERGVNVGGPTITGSGDVIHTHTGRSAASSVSLPPTLAPLRDKLTRYFNKSELKELCFDLGVAHDDLPGNTRTELAQARVEYCYERGRLPELLQRCRAERPPWPGMRFRLV